MYGSGCRKGEKVIVDADYATHFGFADMGVDGLRELAKVLDVKE